jgi:hypothetical protein
MDALSRPWDLYLPKAQQWCHVDVSKPLAANEPFVRIDAKIAPLKVLEGSRQLRAVLAGHVTQSDVELLGRFTSLKSVSLVAPRITSLAPLQALGNLEALELNDPPTLYGLDSLAGLRCLVLRHFRRIKSLSLIESLSKLRVVSMSTIPSWDACRRCLEVESFEPLARLSELESLSLMGVRPLDGRLDPLRRLVDLEYLHISHVYDFALEDYAALARALPKASGHCLQPYYPLPNLSLRCKRCGKGIVFLTGPRPRTRRQLCPACDSDKLAEHVQQWNAVVKTQ